MDWEEVKDPSGEFLLADGWYMQIEPDYDAGEVQDIFNEKGVQQGVHYINNERYPELRYKPLRFKRINGRKAVVSAPAN